MIICVSFKWNYDVFVAYFHSHSHCSLNNLYGECMWSNNPTGISARNTSHLFHGVGLPTLLGVVFIYHLVMTHIAMENPRTKWWFIAGNIIYFYGPFSMAMLNNQRVCLMFGEMLIHLPGTEDMAIYGSDHQQL